LEAKGFRKGATFNVEQLPRELPCLQAHSGNRAPLLLLVLTTPPPIRLAGSGRHEVDAGVAVGLEFLCARAGMTAEDNEALLASIPFCVAWITWSEIYTIVMRQKIALPGLPSSIAASLHRTADGVTQAIKWHSGGLVDPLHQLKPRGTPARGPGRFPRRRRAQHGMNVIIERDEDQGLRSTLPPYSNANPSRYRDRGPFDCACQARPGSPSRSGHWAGPGKGCGNAASAI
jgi:hypothetical protein